MTNHQPDTHLPLLPLSRREFLRNTGLGCGALALSWLLQREGPLANAAVRKPHFEGKAKAVIWLFMTGGPSQVDTFDYKPELQKRDGQKLAGADPQTGFFTTSGKCLQSPFKWKQHGKSGSWVSDVLPNMARHVDDMAFVHSCYSVANNHAPASMELAAGQAKPGYPSMGAWVSYGLGSANDNLPAFVVLHDAKPRGDDGIWSPGFLPKTYQPLLLDARQKESIRNVARAAGMTDGRQKVATGPVTRDEPRTPETARRPARFVGAHPLVRVGLSNADGRPRGARREEGIGSDPQVVRHG